MNKLEKAAVISVIGNAFVSVIKFAAGTTFGSVALVADAIHSFTDIIGSIAVFFGVRFADVKSDKFPYGLYKLENFVSLFIALIIFWSGIEIALESIAKLGSPTQITGFEAIIVAIVALVIVYALAKYKEKIGKAEHSPSMISEAKHSMLDAYGSVGVVAALGLSFAGFPIFDPLIGVIISVLVFKAGLEIFMDSTKVLLDISLDYKTMKKIEKIATAQKGVKVKEILARNSGRYIFVDIMLETGLKDLKKVDKLHRQCETDIRKAVPRIDKIMVDIHYKKKPVLVYAIALEKRSEKSSIAMEFGTAKFFGVFKAENRAGKGGLIESKIIENPHCKNEERKGILAAELLAKNNVDVLFSREKMRKGGAFYALQESFVEMRKTEKKTFNKLLEEFK